MDDAEDLTPEADRLLAATIYLMSCHARNGCPRLACIVGRHLQLLASHPRIGVHVRETSRRLAAAWEAIRRYDEARAAAGEATGRRLH
jgi:hypothetical protein